MLATTSNVRPIRTASAAPDERKRRYILLRKLPSGLRSEVWVAVVPSASGLDDAVIVKEFVPHAPGPALNGLTAELGLSRRLSHPNIVRTLQVGRRSERHFVVTEFLEGATLQSLLLRMKVVGIRLPDAVLVRVLMAIVRAVAYAEEHAISAGSKQLVQRVVPADDVFITYDGAVKLLGFKSRPNASKGDNAEILPCDATTEPAIDALLSDRSTPALRAVMAASGGTGTSDRLEYVEGALQRWQANVLGSDGRVELAELLQRLFPFARIEQRARLEVRLQEAVIARRSSGIVARSLDEGAPPVSGFRPVSS